MKTQLMNLIKWHERGLWFSLIFFAALAAEPLFFPEDIGPNVKTDFGARGDGAADDTEAIRRALADGRSRAEALSNNCDYYGPRPAFLYFPSGVYLVSDTFKLVGQSFTIQGQGRGETVIRIKDGSSRFADASAPRALLTTMVECVNHSYGINVHDLTLHTGSNNPGAIGIRYHANNVGTVENVDIISGDRNGVIGLDLTPGLPGPCMINTVTVDGFDIGIKVDHHEYGVTLQNIILHNQNVCGLYNNTNALGIHRLESSNTVAAIVNTRPAGNWNPGVMTLVDGAFAGGSSSVSAIENDCELYLRDVHAEGSNYRSVVRNKQVVVDGLRHDEFVSSPPTKLWPGGPDNSLGLPIKESPRFHDSDPDNWSRVPKRSDGGVDGERLRQAFNAGKSTVYFPHGIYLMGHTVDIPSSVKRIIGFNSHINQWEAGGGLVLRVVENSPAPLIIERLTHAVRVVHCSDRTVVVKHGAFRFTDSVGTGEWFIEDCVLGDFSLKNKRDVWARQFNVETWDWPHTRIRNTGGGKLWIMGMKTEGYGPIIETSNGSSTELLGGMLYGIDFPDAEWTQPAFIIDNASMSMSFQYSSYGTVDADGDHAMYKTMVREARGTETRELATKELTQKAMPLFVGHEVLRQQARPAPQAGRLKEGGGYGLFRICVPGLHVPPEMRTEHTAWNAFTIRGQRLREKLPGSAGIAIITSEE